jgi:hypothetical protein
VTNAGNFILINGTTVDTDDGEGAFSYTDVLLDSATAPKNMAGLYDVVLGVCEGQNQSLALTKQ